MRRARCRDATIAVVVALLSAVSSSAQEVTEPSLKAAFLYNMAKFVEWPSDVLPDTASLTACVVGDTPVGRALERTVIGRTVSGRAVVVSRIAADASPRACHLLYVSGLAPAQVQQMAAASRGAPILTVIDVETASHRPGGVAHMFVENGKLRFNVDQGLAKRSRLQISSKLLALAKRVYDDPAGGAP